MARLEVSIHELPTKVNTGELHRLVMELYNPSKSPVKVSYLRATPRVLIICCHFFIAGTFIATCQLFHKSSEAGVSSLTACMELAENQIQDHAVKCIIGW